MNIMLFLAILMPVICYVFVEAKYGTRAGLMTAMVLTVLMALFVFIQYPVFDRLFLLEIGLLLALSTISLVKNNPLLFKLQPAIVAVVLSTYIFYMQFFGTPFLLRVASFAEALAPEQAFMFRQPQMQVAMASLSWKVGLFFAAYGIAVAYLAKYGTSRSWLLARLSVYPGLLILMAVGMGVGIS